MSAWNIQSQSLEKSCIPSLRDSEGIINKLQNGVKRFVTGDLSDLQLCSWVSAVFNFFPSSSPPSWPLSFFAHILLPRFLPFFFASFMPFIQPLSCSLFLGLDTNHTRTETRGKSPSWSHHAYMQIHAAGTSRGRGHRQMGGCVSLSVCVL